MRRRTLALALLVSALPALLGTGSARAATPAVRIVVLHGVLTGADADRLGTTLATAAHEGDPLVLLDIDSPGGTAAVVSRIVDAELSAEVPVVAYAGAGAHVDSGALAVLEAAAVVAVDAHAQLGSGHPIDFQSHGFAGVPEGASGPTLAYLATMHGRDGSWLQTLASRPASLSGGDAVRRHIADVTAADIAAVLSALHGTRLGAASGSVAVATAGAQTITVAPSGWDRLVQSLATPDATYALLVIGVLFLGLAIANPGFVFFGLAALAAGAGAVVGFLNLPINPTGLLLMGISFAFFIVDLKAITHGALTVGGAVAMALGGWQMVDTGTLDAGVNPILVVITVSTITAAYAVIVPKLVAARSLPYTEPFTDLVGRVGTVSEPLQPNGYVRIDGVLWRAVATASPQPEGARVRIVEVDGLRLTVEPAPAAEEAS